ncbi:MAG TPA: hypothetical protein VK249_01335 [Anaerolineales bacterium]|nr:hypothetical protein [Anaerolineales bacterium]
MADKFGPENLNTASQSDFSLKKWYLDAADTQGNVYIGYWVSLGWRELRFQGYQHLWHTVQGGLKTQEGLAQLPAPAWQNDQRLTWQPQTAKGTWDSAAEGLSETLLRTDRGAIHWQCAQPKAHAAIQLPQFSLSGWGYTECIDITIPLWKLPFKTLYWGRCHSANHYLVWVKWDGGMSNSLIWHNGQRITDWTLSDRLIRGPDFQLTIDDPAPLRQGKLLSTVLGSFSKLVKLFPKSTFLLDEHKWYSHGRFETQTSSEPATLIYEEVFW